MPGRDSRDKTGRSPRLSVNPPGGGIRPDGPASGGRSDHRAQTPFRDAIGMKRTCRQTSKFDRRRSGPERAPRNRFAHGSDATNPRPGAAPDRVRRGTRDSEIAQKEYEGTPRGNRADPTALGRGRKHGPSLAP